MGTKFSTVSRSGYNASPPADDGTVAASNQVNWSKHKTKLSDPIADQVDSLQTALTSHFNQGPDAKSTNYTTVAGDYNKVLNVTAGVTISLISVASVSTGYRVYVYNSHSSAITVDLANSGDALDGTTNGSVSIPVKGALEFIVSASGNYISLKDGGVDLSSAQTITGDKTFTGAVTGIIPAGAMFDYPSSTEPSGFLLCNGQLVSRTTYATLFSLIGSEYGDGDGSTTFNLPDWRGMFSRYTVDIPDLEFTADAGTDELTTASNHRYYRNGIPVRVSSTTTLPTGLSASTTYYTIYVDADEIQLATSYANALAGTQINITGAGSGTHTITQYLDPDASSRADRGDGTSGDNAGTRQEDELQAHTHSGVVGSTSGVVSASGGTTIPIGAASVGSTGGNETRSVNMGTYRIIKY
mgnify:CR=1 FL=1